MLPKRLNREIIHESKWVNLYKDKVEFSDGRIIDEHYLVHFEQPSVGVVLVNEKKEILLIQSARYTTQMYEWEIPAGGVEKGESLKHAAIRECEEETGYKVKDIKLLKAINMMNGITDKKAYLYVASVTSSDFSGQLTPEEVECFKWFSIDEVKSMIKNEIVCDLSLVGLLLVINEF